jgi:3-oxoacyl-[acyl-carrier-protein] synthase-3
VLVACTTVADVIRRARQAALVIGAETFSRILDWEDRTTCVLFGDGAGAVILEACQVKDPMRERCVIGSLLRSDGRHRDKLFVDGGPSATQTVGKLRMHGKEVFRFAVNAIASVVEDTIAKYKLTPGDIDWFVPHQANKRILDGTAKKVGIAPGKIVVTLDRHGNTRRVHPLASGDGSQDGRSGRDLMPSSHGRRLHGPPTVRW